MSNTSRDNNKQNNKIQNNDSGSAYIKEHAGHVEGYGEPYPVTNNSSDNDRTES